jgi:hypothetical protein
MGVEVSSPTVNIWAGDIETVNNETAIKKNLKKKREAVANCDISTSQSQ